MNKTLEIELSPVEAERLEALALDHGFTDPAEYVKALILMDSEIELDEDIEVDLGDPAENFRQAWLEVKQGNTLSEAEFWKAVADDE